MQFLIDLASTCGLGALFLRKQFLIILSVFWQGSNLMVIKHARGITTFLYTFV